MRSSVAPETQRHQPHHRYKPTIRGLYRDDSFNGEPSSSTSNGEVFHLGMNVYYMCVDPKHFTRTPTFDTLLEEGLLDQDLEVSPSGEGLILEIPSLFESNNTWYRNHEVSYAWTLARRQLDHDDRDPFDRWFYHLFWDPAGELDENMLQRCSLQRKSLSTDHHDYVYSAELVEHICALERDLWEVEFALEHAEQNDRRFRSAMNAINLRGSTPRWLYEPAGFRQVVNDWMQTMRAANARAPGWDLIQHLSF